MAKQLSSFSKTPERITHRNCKRLRRPTPSFIFREDPTLKPSRRFRRKRKAAPKKVAEEVKVEVKDEDRNRDEGDEMDTALIPADLTHKFLERKRARSESVMRMLTGALPATPESSPPPSHEDAPLQEPEGPGPSSFSGSYTGAK